MRTHVVIDRGKFGHRNPQGETKEFAKVNWRRRKKSEKGKEGYARGLARWQEDVRQAQTRPADRTSFLGELDGLALNAPAEPVEKLFFFALDQYRIASDPECSDNRLVRIQFTGKPVCPFRHSRNAVDMSQT